MWLQKLGAREISEENIRTGSDLVEVAKSWLVVIFGTSFLLLSLLR
jgi:hypothetical protein